MFLSNHSTCTQLTECTNDWTLAIKSHNPVDVAYVDFSKALVQSVTLSYDSLVSVVSY